VAEAYASGEIKRFRWRRISFGEPQRAAGILPAEEAWLCRRHLGSTLLERTFAL